MLPLSSRASRLRAPRLLLSPRFSSSSTPPSPSSPAPAPPNRHVRFYRDILPPMARVLAYGSGVYFAAHLVWTVLDGREQRALEGEVRGRLEGEVRARREAAREVGKAEEGKGKKSWMSWFGK